MRFFPDGVETVKKRRGAALRQALTVVVDHILTLDSTSPLHAHVKPLQACVTARAGRWRTTRRRRSRAPSLRRSSRSRAHWLLAYDVLYGEVRSIFAGWRTQAESYLVDGGKVRRAKAAGGNAVAAGAQAAMPEWKGNSENRARAVVADLTGVRSG